MVHSGGYQTLQVKDRTSDSAKMTPVKVLREVRGIDMERGTTIDIIDLAMVAITIEALSTTADIRNIMKDTIGITMNTIDTIMNMTDITVIMIVTTEGDIMVHTTSIMITIEDTRDGGVQAVVKKTGQGTATKAAAAVVVGIRVNIMVATMVDTKGMEVPVAVKKVGLGVGVVVTRIAERENVAKSTKHHPTMLPVCRH